MPDTEPKPENEVELTEQSEDQLIKMAMDGNDEAYAELVRRHQARLRAFASRYLDSSQDVFELVQDAFIDAYRHLDRFDTSRDFSPWLRAICKNRVLNHLRHKKRKRAVQLSLVDDAILDHISASEPAEVDNVERMEALKQCMQKLGQAQYRLIQLRYYSQQAVKDIASSLGSSSEAVAMRLMRTREKLRKCVNKQLRTDA